MGLFDFSVVSKTPLIFHGYDPFYTFFYYMMKQIMDFRVINDHYQT